MTDDEKTGLFTYESYLQHLLARERRAHAERVGFIDASLGPRLRKHITPTCTKEFIEGYDTGFALGQIYLKKKEQGT